MKILILHGPNLNMLGRREKEHYGSGDQLELMRLLEESFPHDTFELFQSNFEGELAERIHRAIDEPFDAVIVNFGGLTHTSVTLRDALSLMPQDLVEVHLSNIHARESFRHTSLTGGVCRGMISGFGFYGYQMAVNALHHHHNHNTG